MEVENIGNRIKIWIIKFRYPILVLLIGLGLLIVPGRFQKTEETSSVAPAPTQVQDDLSQQLTDILRQIRGVGKVQVLLTISKGERTEYQQDEDQHTTETESSIQKETIIIRDGEDAESALIIQVIPPEYLGAVVVCEGADDANVKLAIVDAVSKATGLRSDSISVLKMK